MGRLKKTIFEEVRVQVSIYYGLGKGKDDSKLFDTVKDTDSFKAYG